MKYRCKKAITGLTVGKIYDEYFPHPCVFNACITNDNGKVMHVPRNQFFDIESDVIEE